MQVIYGPNASNILITAQKRLLRPVYAQTQGFPYAATLDPSLRTTAGNFLSPLSSDTAGATTNGRAASNPLGYSAPTFTYQGSVVPGTVLVKTASEYVTIANGANAAVPQPFGLLGQWLGGIFDNLGQNNQVSAWMGPDSVYEILAPGWNDSGLAAAMNVTGTPVLMSAGADGRLTLQSVAGASTTPVCRCLDRVAGSRILVQLLI